MTRIEHLAWCKKRAMECVDLGLPGKAISSMISDLGKHPQTERSAFLGGMIAPLFTPSGGSMENWSAEVRKWIEGFN